MATPKTRLLRQLSSKDLVDFPLALNRLRKYVSATEKLHSIFDDTGYGVSTIVLVLRGDEEKQEENFLQFNKVLLGIFDDWSLWVERAGGFYFPILDSQWNNSNVSCHVYHLAIPESGLPGSELLDRLINDHGYGEDMSWLILRDRELVALPLDKEATFEFFSKTAFSADGHVNRWWV